jgi:hypothetical protein
MLRQPNQVRQAFGPGWALVGDAGYHRDAVTAHGISDAFRDAEFLAVALDQALSAGVEETTALALYQRQRDQALREIFEITCRLAAYPAVPMFIELQKQLSAAIDTEAAGNNSGSTCTTCTAPALTLGGSNDYVLQWIADDDQAGPPFGVASISSPYSNPFDNSDSTVLTAGLAGAINQSTYSQPTWTLQQTAKVSMSVIALKSKNFS